MYHLAVVDVFYNGYLVGQKGSTGVSDKTKDPDGLSPKMIIRRKLNSVFLLKYLLIELISSVLRGMK